VTLHDCARPHGDIEHLRQLLESGADVEAMDDELRTPLACAATFGNFPAAKLLIEHGANPLAAPPGAPWATPLEKAVTCGHGDIVDLFLRSGINLRDLRDPAELMFGAIYGGRFAATAALVAHGIDVNVRRPTDGQTPLHWAVERGQIDTVRLLLDAGADPTAFDRSGSNPWHVASFMGHTRIAELLRSAIDE
jgi:ankyrin repeat protein